MARQTCSTGSSRSSRSNHTSRYGENSKGKPDCLVLLISPGMPGTTVTSVLLASHCNVTDASSKTSARASPRQTPLYIGPFSTIVGTVNTHPGVAPKSHVAKSPAVFTSHPVISHVRLHKHPITRKPVVKERRWRCCWRI